MDRRNALTVVKLALITTIFLITSRNETNACSMYKITVGNKTMVGCNEDAWRTTPRIWFRTANVNHKYGAGFTGSRRVSNDQFAPQSGMNEAGLVFSRLASYHPVRNIPATNRKEIRNEVSYLSDILHTCANVEDVKRYIDQYDHSFFLDDVFIYVDSTGKFLIVEPYELTVGDEATYVLSNFCPSIADHEKIRKLERYRNGVDFLSAHKMEASLPFCTALSDTMHVCRNRNGDGTLLTSIWDTKDKVVDLFFYHNYDTKIQFDLSEELAKGDHSMDVVSLFPANHEFEQFSNYITPFNTPGLRVFLVLIGGILTLLSFLFAIIYFIKRKKVKSIKTIIYFASLNLLLTGYLFVLATNINIYYFDAPYQHYNSTLISIYSYLPFLLLLFSVPLIIYTFNFNKSHRKERWIKSLLIFNNLLYIVSILGFGYWGLFDVLK